MRIFRFFVLFGLLMTGGFCVAQNDAEIDSILRYQLPNGGWMKNQDWLRGVDQTEYRQALETGVGATIDNQATWGEIRHLASYFAAIDKMSPKAQAVASAVNRGLEYLLQMQYANGGFPQFYPQKKDEHYSRQITFNDGAMVQVLRLLRDVADQRTPFSLMPIPVELRKRCGEAYERGIGCVLSCQVRLKGKLTVWCQQHDCETLQPVGARAYELPSLCGAGETADILRLLMEVRQPSEEIKTAVRSGVEWLRSHALHGKRVETFVNADGKKDLRLIDDPSAPLLWARFYDLKKQQPFFSDRTGKMFRNFSDIQYEGRNGFAWFGYQPQKLLEEYEVWKKVKSEE